LSPPPPPNSLALLILLNTVVSMVPAVFVLFKTSLTYFLYKSDEINEKFQIWRHCYKTCFICHWRFDKISFSICPCQVFSGQYIILMEEPVRDKHSGLFCRSVSNGLKKFYNNGAKFEISQRFDLASTKNMSKSF